MDKDKYVNIDPKAKPVNQDSEQDQTKTAEANMKLQDAFYDENESNGVDPANLNNQTAILTDMD
ncbi:hypothetical protein LC048_01265 [Mesobacillus subterraneus]|uniref:hypothetical protein n=1 Tax=Mesobacillus subterraneus TaxID=285983 RepID=UPI001CFD8EDF|nr:hypothetical protein [Mesobacillus subterraneus]WLR55673.1 hypothetical protein LC048_01265 [Mesobacillus subterraneus]